MLQASTTQLNQAQLLRLRVITKIHRAHCHGLMEVLLPRKLASRSLRSHSMTTVDRSQLFCQPTAEMQRWETTSLRLKFLTQPRTHLHPQMEVATQQQIQDAQAMDLRTAYG